MSKEALKLALEALKGVYQYGSDTLSGPVKGQPDDRKWQRDGVLEMTNRAYKGIKALEEALAKQEHGEPVGTAGELFTNTALERLDFRPSTKIYTTPQQRTAAVGEDTRRAWVGLTDEDKAMCVQATAKRGSTYELIAAIEAKLRSKNT